MTELEAVDPQERFQEFFKTEKYRKSLSQMAIAGKSSVIVEFEDLLACLLYTSPSPRDS